MARTRYGPVIGKVEQGALAFKGIPYGAPTSGSGRFMPPTPPQPWSTPLRAFDYGPTAPQSDPQDALESGAADARESEDCLTLNVWTPSLNDQRKRPVMVWLHGGGLWRLSAAGDYQAGTHLAAHSDVVMVSPNHRLNVLAHAYLDEYDPAFAGSSSAGMLDLVLALKWVRDNIEEFGGDPDNVTIFGQSGGGQKVSFLMAMPAAAGLFHKAIIQSGPAPLALEKPYARELSARLLTLLDIPKNRVRDIQNVPLDAIMRAYYQIFEELGGFGVMGVIQDFAPVVDDVALPQHPFWNGASPLSRDVPLMIGCTRTEMTEYFLASNPGAAKRDFAAVTAQLEPVFGMQAPAVVAHYRATHPTASPWEVDALIRSDWPTRLFTQRIADEQVKLGGAPVWMYRMDWQTTARDGLLMSPHAIDIPFVLDTVGTEPVEPGQLAEQQRMMQQMNNAWVSFARNGNPQNKYIPPWQPYNSTSRPTMIFNLHSHMANDPDGSDLAFLKKDLANLEVVAGGVTHPPVLEKSS
ncbi:carboxylesterase family protein [Altererythrobacter indicus]|uniref:Carboxylic ester hydrolase n=1 Tax=Altericroceibacterium indicum TaxID=374177 RepID=A0A845ADQ8_9SPHN|nr:carboxylesterase family protein [Altericroceibacterium indicum]MXP27111.1 carboxylesterase family protein [Altericroceibacterium indicum]